MVIYLTIPLTTTDLKLQINIWPSSDNLVHLVVSSRIFGGRLGEESNGFSR